MRERERVRDIETVRETEREMGERESERVTDTERETERVKKRLRVRDIETVRETEREREKESERGRIFSGLYKCIAILPSILSVGYLYSLRRIRSITRCVSEGKKHLGSQLV